MALYNFLNLFYLNYFFFEFLCFIYLNDFLHECHLIRLGVDNVPAGGIFFTGKKIVQNK